MDNQSLIMKVEFALRKLGGEQYYQAASQISNMANKYAPGKQDEFLNELLELISKPTYSAPSN